MIGYVCFQMAAPEIVPLEVPAELVLKSNGFALDCGKIIIYDKNRHNYYLNIIIKFGIV